MAGLRRPVFHRQEQAKSRLLTVFLPRGAGRKEQPLSTSTPHPSPAVSGSTTAEQVTNLPSGSCRPWCLNPGWRSNVSIEEAPRWRGTASEVRSGSDSGGRSCGGGETMRFIKLSLSICTLVGIVTFQARGEDEPKAPATKSFTHLVSHQGHTADTAAVRLGRPTCRPGRGVHEEVEGTGAPCRDVHR